MPLYARADVLSVSIGQSHGGCGTTHRRPMVQGSAVKIWELSCPQCQGHLAHDPLWAGSPADIPATPDEQRTKDNTSVILGRNRDDIMAMALAKLAGLPVGDLFDANSTETHVVTCSNGHSNFPTAKFCGDCGEPLAGLAGEVVSSKPATAAALDGSREEPVNGDSASEASSERGTTLSPAEVTTAAKPVKPSRQPRQPREAREVRPTRVIPPATPTSLEDEITSVPSI